MSQWHCRFKKEVILAVTVDPMKDEIFTAEKGRGAKLNGAAIQVSSSKSLPESIIATGFPYDRATNNDNNLLEFSNIMPEVQGIRRGGFSSPGPRIRRMWSS